MAKNIASTRIIDHKRVLITDDEFTLYNKICRSYDTEHRKGEDLFVDHFEANDAGIIIFVKPAHNKYSSLEIYCFLVSLMVNQHLRNVQEQASVMVQEASAKYNEKIKEIDLKLAELKSLMATKNTE